MEGVKNDQLAIAVVGRDDIGAGERPADRIVLGIFHDSPFQCRLIDSDTMRPNNKALSCRRRPAIVY